MIAPTRIGLPGTSTRDAQAVFAKWVEHAGTREMHPTLTDEDWQERLRAYGPHLVSVEGRMHEFRTGPRMNDTELIAEGGITRIDAARFVGPDMFDPPQHLYRAAAPDRADRMMWFDRFDMAKLIADDFGGMRIWTAEADEVFGKIVMDRTEPGGYREAWNEWIVKPKNVREISRHVDPFKPIENIEAWEKRGLHVMHAASLVWQWARATSNRAAPMDREQGGYWLSQFQDMGQFEAHISWDGSKTDVAASTEVVPVAELQPPPKLYRGAPEATKGRWSWTAEPETAQWFVDMFCPDDGVIWECEASRVYGVIKCHVENPEPGHPAAFSEWIMHPDESTIHRWFPTAE
jgi:hypothetical protein